MNNVRFATSLHILTLLGMAGGKLLSSDYIAGSVNMNAASIRKELTNLREYGLVQSKEGKGGGNMLAKMPAKIQLSEVYNAVRTSALLGRSNEPNAGCIVGRQINAHLETLYSNAEEILVKQLGKQNLAQFIRQFT